MENKALLLAWVVAFLVVVVLGMKYGQRSDIYYYGMADAVEWSLTYDHPVKIKSIKVVSGQYFRKGELLIELDQAELEIKISNLKYQLLSLQTELSLLQGIQSNLSEPVSKTKKTTARKRKNVEIRDRNPIELNIKKLKAELVLLEKENENLYFFAKFSGSVGNSKFSPGETVSPFTPILTLNRNVPTYVKAYVREENLSPVFVGQSVVVSSIVNPEKLSDGKIFTIGGRINQIPERMNPFATIPLFGREVLVTLPEDNPFVLGEKLGISGYTPSFFENLSPLLAPPLSAAPDAGAKK